MFSGKTTELMRRLKRYTVAQYRCIIIKYFKDDRYCDSSISSHDGHILSATSCSNLFDVADSANKFDVIGIDEGQFFQDVISFSEKMANNGKIVIVAALDATFQRTEFGKILQLVPLAESVVKLNAVCMSCFSDASFTKRISNEKELEIIGGADKYMAVCRECHKLERPIKNSPCKLYQESLIQNNHNNIPKFTI